MMEYNNYNLNEFLDPQKYSEKLNESIDKLNDLDQTTKKLKNEWKEHICDPLSKINISQPNTEIDLIYENIHKDFKETFYSLFFALNIVMRDNKIYHLDLKSTHKDYIKLYDMFSNINNDIRETQIEEYDKNLHAKTAIEIYRIVDNLFKFFEKLQEYIQASLNVYEQYAQETYKPYYNFIFSLIKKQNELNDKIYSCKYTMEQAEKQIEIQQNLRNKEKQSSKEQMDDYQREIKELRKARETIIEQRENFRDNVVRIREQLKQEITNYKILQETNKQLETTHEELCKQIKTFESQIAIDFKIEEEIKQLEAQLKTQKEINEEQETEIIKIKEYNNNSHTQFLGLESNFTDLRTEKTQLITNIENNEIKIEKLKSQNRNKFILIIVLCIIIVYLVYQNKQNIL